MTLRPSIGVGLALALAAVALAAPVSVSIQSPEPGRFELHRAGRPYYVRGAGVDGHLDELVAAGGNSIRTWGAEQATKVIDDAGRRGLTVCAGLWIEHERGGFDYDNAVAVRAQVDRLCRTVDRLKDKPALLLWGVGNEVEFQSRNPKVWETIEAVAAYIKRVDPHHPVMTVITHPRPAIVAEIRRRCPSIDILGCNSYAGLRVLAADVRACGWTGPYLVTEWGTDGSWEVAKTPWGAEIEPTSAEKAALFAARYRAIAADRERCLGSYAFLWGQKQEATPTWFGLFTEDGRASEAVEVLAAAWSERPLETKTPQVGPLTLNGALAQAGVTLAPGAVAKVEGSILRGASAGLRVRWELLPERRHKGAGGDPEKRPKALRLPPQETAPSGERCVAEFAAPRKPGAYRIFVYIEGPHSTVAHANLPFLVVAP
ncbi:MAG: glycoside hydrolase family 2 TIM barrel-domain containing protein [Opitutaceae bacterium]